MKLKKVILTAAATAFILQASAYAADLTASYSMDDMTGLTYMGTVSNILGQKNNAVEFNGGSATLSQFPLSDNFTVSAWIKPSGLTSWERVFDFGSDQKNYIFLTVNNGNGYPRLAVKYNNQKEQNITSSVSLNKNVWSYVTVTMKDNKATMYINGESVASGNITVSMSSLASSAANYIAKSQYTSDPNYTGCIDEMEIYNDALTQDEIITRMQATAAEVKSIETTDLTVKVGDKIKLPSEVDVSYTNGMTSKTIVDWGEVSSYTEKGTYKVTGTTKIAGKSYDVIANITVETDSLDDNYSVIRNMNIVKNSGSSFVEAEYVVTSELTDTLVLKMQIYSGDTLLSEDTKDFVPSDNTVKMKKDIRDYKGNLTVKTAVYNKSTGKVISSVMERKADNTGNFAGTDRVNLEKDSLFEKSEQVGLKYVLSIDVDRLLAPSYEMHGLTAPNNAQRYGGWERKGASNWGSSKDTFTLAGHSLGHWMSAAAVLYRDTGNEEVLTKLNYAVTKLDELQKTSNSPYIGGCSEDCFTKLFSGNTKWADNYWVPWYGIHKIYQGLLDAYDYTENDTAYEVLKKFADWAVDGTSNLTDAQMQSMLDVEYGGMNEIFARMYEITGDEKYLDTARRFTHDSILNPLIQGKDSLTGLHANTQIPKIIGAAEIYEQNPEKYADYKKACENFWNYVVNNRSYAIGGNSIAEHFEAEGAETLGVKTCESCNTYNMMRLSEHLFAWKHDSAYMDWYEKALYNHILGQQEPETGAKMYFVSLLQGHHRVYEQKDKSWWCCTGTGMENPGRYTRCAYYEDGDDLYVNLYMPGTYEWEEKGLTFTVETTYPYSDKVQIKVAGTGSANINLRAPSWLESDMTVKADNKTYISKGGEYLAISNEWKDGDIIDITIPMSVTVYNSRIDGQAAYQYGPVVLAADLGSVSDVSGVNEYISNETKIDSVTADVPYIVGNSSNLDKYIDTVDTDKLMFKIKAENSSTGKDIELKPFYEIHHSFYTVYFNVGNGVNEYDKRLNSATIDRVEPDGQQDELGHGLASENSNNGSFTSGTKTYYWRDAYGSDNTYFQYSLEVDKSNKNYLFVRYWGSDGSFTKNNVNYTRDFYIYIDDNKLAEQTLNNEKMNNAYDVFYEIPEEYTKGKDSVTVKFAPKSSTNCAGGVIEARITNDDLKCVKITADYNDNGTLKDSSIEKISIEDIKQTENSSSHKEFYWESTDNMKPIITEE